MSREPKRAGALTLAPDNSGLSARFLTVAH